MERRKIWVCFSFRSAFLVPMKRMFIAVASHLRIRTRGKIIHLSEILDFAFFSIKPFFYCCCFSENRNGMATLCRDMEAFAGYSDIQVMWEMIKSSHQ